MSFAFLNGFQARTFATAAMLSGAVFLTGCEKRERVIDVDTPGVDIKVDKTTDPQGNVGIEIDTSGN